ncbi:MAG: anthranilate synthase component I, partial [Rickettsiales bacterium]|nr:anthranilate synthase component I [Rickettsiales bacterium]
MEAFSPNHKIFKKIYDSGKPQVLFTTLSADLYTPVSTLIKFKNHKYTFLFESVEKGNNKGRYSFLGIEPDLIWECKNKKCLVRNLKENTVDKIKNETPIESLRKFFLKNKFVIPKNLPPMSSGLFGYIGYDMIQNFENIDLKNIDDLNIPDSIFIRPTLMLIFDNVSDKLYIVKSIWPASSRAEIVLE